MSPTDPTTEPNGTESRDRLGHDPRVVRVTDRISVSFVDEHRHVTDSDLADHVRTKLGPIVKALDLPRIHVMAEGLNVLLHGEVGTETDAIAIEDAVLSIPGVIGVESHLHVGLIPGDTRPSQSKPGPSKTMIRLREATENLGIESMVAKSAALRGALTVLFEQIPPGERRHVIGHLPADVVAFINPRRNIGEAKVHWRRPLMLDVAVALRGGIPLEAAILLVPKLINVIRTAVPEEDADVQATLSRHLREFWSRQGSPM